MILQEIKLLAGSQKKAGQLLKDILMQYMNKKIKPTFEEEKRLIKSGYKIVAGLDEVGRGALAGPIVASAIVFDIEKTFYSLNKIADSKILNMFNREKIDLYIRKNAQSIGIGVVEPSDIDKFGIGKANVLAFHRALEEIDIDFALIDGRHFRGFEYNYRCIIKGDSKSISIAAASIVAKVFRDNLMNELHHYNSIYGFDKHKGYGAKSHIAALLKHGPSKYHRKSFLQKLNLDQIYKIDL